MAFFSSFIESKRNRTNERQALDCLNRFISYWKHRNNNSAQFLLIQDLEGKVSFEKNKYLIVTDLNEKHQKKIKWLNVRTEN